MKFKEFPKMIYPEGKDPVIVKSVEEENRILGKTKEAKTQITNQPDRPQGPEEKKQKKVEPKKTNMLKCKFCGKEYKRPLHLHPHERRCEMNPENMKDADGK